MTKNAPDDRDELRATAENPPTPESHPRKSSPDDPTRLERRDQFESELGGNGNASKTSSHGGTKDDSSGDSDQSGKLQWLRPDDSDTDNDGRTGFLSTRLECHAIVLGISAGALAADTGQFNDIVEIVGAGTAGSRAQQGFPDNYVKQARKELPTFLVGVLIGFVAARAHVLADIGLGMGV